MRYLFIASLLLSMSSCSVFNSKVSNEEGLTSTEKLEKKVIANLGNKDGTIFQKNIYANSFESLVIAFSNTDGAQIDLQLSKDSTIWLFGEENIRDCRFQEFKSLSEYNDKDISFASICWYENQLIPLDTFIYLMDSANFTNKIISFNLQSFNDPVALEHFGGEENIASLLASQLNDLEALNKIHFVVEIPTLSAIEHFKKGSDLKSYLRVAKDAKVKDYPDLSISIDKIKLMNKSVVSSLQLWGVNNLDQLAEALEKDVDIIQIMDVEMAGFYLGKGEFIEKSIKKDSLFDNQSDTIFVATIKENELKESFIAELIVNKSDQLDGLSYYIRGLNADGHEVSWTSGIFQKGQSSYSTFFSESELESKAYKKIVFYILNNNINAESKVIFELKKLNKKSEE